MSTKKFTYKPIYTGYEWKLRLQLNATPALFPAGVKLRAQVRVSPDDAKPLTTLTVDDGQILRVDDNTIQITIPETASNKWEEGSVMFDLVRTDVEPDQHLGVRVTVQVKKSVTVR